MTLRCPRCGGAVPLPEGPVSEGRRGRPDRADAAAAARTVPVRPGEAPVACAACGAAILAVGGVPDFAPHVALADPSFGREQRVMNTRAFARLYETRVWRPLHGWIASRESVDREIGAVLDLGGPGGRSSARGRVEDRAPGPVRAALDVACGTGLYTREMARRWPDAEVLGVDLSVGMLSRARELAAREGLAVPFVRGDIHHLPLPDAAVDRVNCSGALHLFPDRPRVWRELARVLAPGGVLTAMTVARRKLGRASLQAVLERAVSFRFFDPDALREELRLHGFGEVRTVVRHAALYFAAVRE